MKLSTAFEGYRISKLAEGYSRDTIARYRNCWRLFTGLKGDMELNEITHQDLTEFFYWLRTEYTPNRRNGDTSPLKSSSLYAVWKSIRSFFGWAEIELGIKPYRQRQRRDVQPVGRRLKIDEVRLLRSAIDARTNKGKRDRAIIDLMLFAGLRRSEVAGLRTEQVKQEGGRWWLHVIGKGDKPRRVKSHNTLYNSLKAWVDAAGLELGAEGGRDFCSVNKGDNLTGGKLAGNVIGRLVAEYGSLSGLAPLRGDNRLSPHDLRRTMARNAHDNGAGLIIVQQVLGHADPKTTSRYIGAYEDDDNTAIDYVRY